MDEIVRKKLLPKLSSEYINSLGKDVINNIRQFFDNVSNTLKENNKQLEVEGEQLKAMLPDWLKYDYSQHKTRRTLTPVGSDNRHVSEKRGGKI